MRHTYRYLARVIIEAVTPLAVGCGERDVITDRLVITDVNGLPYIPGTALSGVLRHSLAGMGDNAIDQLFGFQKDDKGQGSKLILSSAQMVGKEGVVLDGIKDFDFRDAAFYQYFNSLPIRQHVRIAHTGAAETHGKFDEQVVYKGARFCFEMEMIGNEQDIIVWNQILTEFTNPLFRIGGGTRKGFGEISVVECKQTAINLCIELDKYLTKTSELNDPFWNLIQPIALQGYVDSQWISYELTLRADDFFLFGSGFSSDNGDADMTFVTEKTILWTVGKPALSDEKILIPATSVKGALAHRVAFHYNKLCGITAEKLKESVSINLLLKNGFYDFRNKPNDKFDSSIYSDRIKLVTTYNPAVRKMFGFAVDEQKENGAQRGDAIFSDVFLSSKPNKKLINHVAIDRFTGGAIDGALFTEEVTNTKEGFSLKIAVNKKAIESEKYLKAFEAALIDICTGMLPLGGGTMRGNGCFTGILTKNKEVIYNGKQ